MKTGGRLSAQEWMAEIKNKIDEAREDVAPAVFSMIAEGISDGYHTFGELYDHRFALFAALCRSIAEDDSYPVSMVWKSRAHSDGSKFEGWFIMGLVTEPGKQITYHLPDKLWDRCGFATNLIKAPEWDGHTPADVVDRLWRL